MEVSGDLSREAGRAAPQGIGQRARRPVLVAYATRKGATAGVADRIALRLETGGLSAESHPVEEVAFLGGYEAVILGGGIYGQAWPGEAWEFVKRHEEALIAMETWLFSVGAFGDHETVLGKGIAKEPTGIQWLQTRLGAHEYRVFAGIMEAEQWPLTRRLLFRALGGEFGDRRDWPQIDAWAGRIAAALTSEREPLRTRSPAS